MAAELTITIWTEGPADAGTSKALGEAACQTILNQSGGSYRATVINAQAFELPIDALRMVLPVEEAAQPTPLASPVPPADPLAAPELPIEAISPFELPAPPVSEPQPTNPDGSAIPTPDATVPTIADWMAAAGQPVVQVAPGIVEVVAPPADTKPAETVPVEVVPPAVDAAVSATSDYAQAAAPAPEAVPMAEPDTAAQAAAPAPVDLAAALLESLAPAAEAKADLDANGSFS